MGVQGIEQKLPQSGERWQETRQGHGRNVGGGEKQIHPRKRMGACPESLEWSLQLPLGRPRTRHYPDARPQVDR